MQYTYFSLLFIVNIYHINQFIHPRVGLHAIGYLLASNATNCKVHVDIPLFLTT